MPLDQGLAAAARGIDRENPSPWSLAALADELRRPHVDALGVVRGGGLAGFVLWSRVADEGELRRIAVAAAHRRRGVGQALLTVALERMELAGARRCFLEVRAGNEAAIGLYRRAGFRRAGIRRAYYRRPVEDALVFVKEITGSEEHQGD